jgi:hypothetical protein
MSYNTPIVLIVLWINFIITAVPLRLMATYTELLIGALISGSGHVTDAMFAVGHLKHFSTYYWLIERAKWSWLQVNQQLIRLVVIFFPRQEWNILFDDFICPRTSKKAPFVTYHHEHSQKPNRPRYIWGQQWIALGLALNYGKICASLPLLLRLHKSVGNRTKITTALLLLTKVVPLFYHTGKEKIRCYVDAWFMKSTFILPVLKMGIHVVGQVRKDTVLFREPKPVAASSRKRGRPKKYGEKWTAERVKEQLPLCRTTSNIYGGCKEVKYRTTRCLARFLLGLPVIAVWCQLPDQKSWTLILSTDLSLTPERIIKLYARRWKIEPMFNEIKHAFGIANAWEQTSRALHRWVSMLCVAYSLTRMVSLVIAAKKEQHFVPFIQWRAKSVVTAGLVRKGIQFFFRQFTFSQLWEPKSKKLILSKNKNMNSNSRMEYHL